MKPTSTMLLYANSAASRFHLMSLAITKSGVVSSHLDQPMLGKKCFEAGQLFIELVWELSRLVVGELILAKLARELEVDWDPFRVAELEKYANQFADQLMAWPKKFEAHFTRMMATRTDENEMGTCANHDVLISIVPVVASEIIMDVAKISESLRQMTPAIQAAKNTTNPAEN
jgi:hypothetical protein